MQHFFSQKDRSNAGFHLPFLFFVGILSCCQLWAQPTLTLSPVINSGLSSPTQLVNAGDGSKRVFIVQKGGTVRVYDSTFQFLSTFLTVPNITTNGERGLLSMAFHPDYKNNGFCYVYYTNAAGNLEISRYRVSAANPNLADPDSRVIVISIPHPNFSNHNGGELHFGKDGYLYLSTGDGGGGGDPSNNAQNTSVLLGKMLRFNVNTAATPPYYTIPPGNPFNNEIFALGLRNPYRWSFDRQTGDMWIGDVGQDAWEEINFRAANALLGANYGWRCYEGNATYNTAGCGAASNYVPPVHAYPTQNPAASITGGVVYRGKVYPNLVGCYIGADFYSGVFYKIVPNASGGFTTQTQNLSPTGIVDFGEAENGEVYAVSLTNNSVWRVAAVGTTSSTDLTQPETVANIYPTLLQEGVIQIELLQANARAVLECLDLQGKTILKKELPAQTGIHRFSLPSGLAQGLYVVQIRSTKGVFSKQVFYAK